MSRSKSRKPRRGQQKRAQANAVITLVEGVGKGMRFEVPWSEEEVAEARRSCAAGQPNLTALCIVLAFLRYLGAPCSPEAFDDPEIWPADDVLTLYDMLGMPLTGGWTAATDSELAALLAGSEGSRG